MSKKKKAARKQARKSTALAVRKLVAPKPRALPAHIVVEPKGHHVAADGSLQLGALGLVELKLTEAEELVLNRPVNPDDIQWKASRRNGPKDIPYLPHIVYTRWFNEAFGRVGWNLVPIGKPTKSDTNVVLLPYVLHVHKLPVAFAWGEQEYFPNKADGSENRAQSYGDVIESTVGSALRRCAKHLGIGLEMWDRDWLDQLTKPADQQRQKQRQEKRTAPVEHADLDQKISDEARLRLWNISRRVGRGDTEVQDWLKRRFKVATSSDITNRDYDRIVSAIEQRGPLPEK